MADTVIFYDSDWNPQMDRQAMDRVHRIGQTKPVLVIRLAHWASIEMTLLERAQSKRVLERLVMNRKRFKGIRSPSTTGEASVLDWQSLVEEARREMEQVGECRELSDAELRNLLSRV